MPLDQTATRPGAPARSVASGRPTPDPLAELARLIAQDETFATIVRNKDGSERRVDFGVRPDARPASGRARADIPSKDLDGDEGSHAAAAEAAEGPNGEPHNSYDYGDCDEPSYSNEVPVWRRRLRVCAAIVGLALLGSASALAYRAWFDERPSRPEAPATASSTAPQKLTPSAQQADTPSAERLRAQSNVGGGDGTVSGEEKAADTQSAMPPALPPIGVPSGPGPTQVAALTPGPAPADSPVATQDQLPPSNDAAPAPTTPNATKYIVQLSSQRSEAAAQATSRGLQTKHADLFGGLAPVIRRSDLRERGVYFRVVIGPFSTFGEANQLCGSLKKSGGDCVVQRN